MEDERSLAHIERVKALHPIKGADRIEKAIILGWECVVKKGEFKVGERIVYIEIDSIVPDEPQFEFLAKKKYRVKTIRLKGQVSQGLVIPLTLKGSFKDGDDVTKELGIIKYLPPSERYEIKLQKKNETKLRKFMRRYSWYRKIFLKSKKAKSSFPYWVSKTDEPRIQNLTNLEELLDKEVYITEKIDYQSGTWTAKEVPIYNGLLGKIFKKTKMQFVVASRNIINNDKNSLYWKIAEKYNLKKILSTNKYHTKGWTIQGEQGNIGVQGNKYKLKFRYSSIII